MLKKIKHIWAENLLDSQANINKIKQKKSFEFIGANDDRGVLNVGGRIGAGLGPDKIRTLLGEYMLGMNSELARVEIWKGKNLPRTKTIEEAHNFVRNKVKSCFDLGIMPIVLGGGHDYGYPHYAGVIDFFKKPIALINVDAHLDVRPIHENGITSGSPFFLCLESGILSPKYFVEFGIQSKCNDASLFTYIRNKKVKTIMLDEAREYKNGWLSLESFNFGISRPVRDS